MVSYHSNKKITKDISLSLPSQLCVLFKIFFAFMAVKSNLGCPYIFLDVWPFLGARLTLWGLYSSGKCISLSQQLPTANNITENLGLQIHPHHYSFSQVISALQFLKRRTVSLTISIKRNLSSFSHIRLWCMYTSEWRERK